MATQTTHFDMVKQQSAEHVSVGLLNDNFDIIDQVMFDNQEKSEQLADEYNAGTTYNVGDYVRRENYIYKCNTASTTGVWDSTKWDRVKVMESVETAEDGVDNAFKTMGVIGAKNLLPYPYYESSHPDTGITWTVDDDGTVVANGTVSSTTATSIFLCRFREPHSLKAGRYILSGCPSGGTNTTYYMWMCFYNPINGSNVGSMYSYGGDTPFEVLSEYENYTLVVGCYCRYGYTANNLKFYPMIRPVEYQDSTWQPYAQTNKELTENKVDWVSNGVLGAKNLNSYPYNQDSRTIRDVVWTINSDGSVTANGKATGGSSNFACHSRLANSLNNLVLPNGRYKLTGCPSDGSASTYYAGLGRTKNNAFESIAIDYGDGVEFTLNGDDYSNNEVMLQIALTIVNNYNASNITFKPMIRRIEDTDDTYQPYAMTNKELTDVVNNVPTTAGTYTLQAVRNADNTITYSWV